MPRRRKPKHTPLSAGLTLIAVGCLLLLAPTLLGSNPVFTAIKAGTRTPAWWAIGLGILLVGLHALLLKRQVSRPIATVPATRRPAAARKVSVSQEPDTPRHTMGAEGRIEPTFTPAPPDARLPAPAPAHQRLTRWSPEVFAAIEWRRFEAVVEQLFAQAGFETRAQSHGADGGVDVWLHSRHAGGAPVGVVQCKHWQGKPVPVSAMREFFGVMASHGLKRGTYATTSRFTADALDFARANGINAQDGAGLLALIAARTPQQQAALLATAFDGDYWRPTCPSCGVKMADRASRKTGERFWGCTHYPRCKYTQPMTSAVAAALA